ncbi:MAG: prolyl oligopeptidase family serine peptidase [Bacteroidales bacterium]|nr:prolyl oligopeptidase family serine peptidase [Candidatus Cacconaster merdequi]
MRRLVFAIIAVFLCVSLYAQEPSYEKVRFQGYEREYFVVVPDSIAAERPLVVLLHGYGGSARGYRPEMVDLARKEGFVLCIPQGFKDPSGECGWNVRYPNQEGLGTDDVAFVSFLVRKMCRKYGLNRDNVFLTGMSNGGEMCYIMACERPEMFRAIASVAGLTMNWLVEERPAPSKPVPFMEIHGTADRVSMWNGDPENTGGWGAYCSVPLAVGRICAANKCTYEVIENLPLLKESSRQIILHRYLGGAAEVRLYEVAGGPHSWHLDDIDTVSEIWAFFKAQM